MDVLIISVNRNLHPAPVMPAGACVAAEAAERAGHEVRFLDLMFSHDPLGAVEDALIGRGADVVGLSVRNIDNNDMRTPAFFAGELGPLVETVRKWTDAAVVLGGAAVGVMPEELLRHTGAECAVPGDGEAVFPELLQNIARGDFRKTPGVAWIEDGVFRKNPARSKFTGYFSVPDYRRWVDVRAYLANMSSVPLQAKLGCHFRCVYCTYRKIEGNRYRCFDPESVVEAVSRLARQGLRDIEFVDNVFNSPYAHAMAVCKGLARAGHGARLQSVELNPGLLDGELLAAMEHAGFVGVGITAESASDQVLSGLGKGFTAGDVCRAAEAVNSHRLPCLWIFMLGGPGETRETVRETLMFAQTRVRPKDAAFFNIGVRIYPGTELESIARGEGLLSLAPQEMLRPVFYVSPQVDFAWMANEVKKAMAEHMNFIDSDSIGLSCLPGINRASYRLGLRPPLWRHTRLIRRGLGMFGAEA